MSNDLVSIIMLSRNKGCYVAESVRSVIAQTYQNWELIFMDDSSNDDTISQMMDLINVTRTCPLSLVQCLDDNPVPVKHIYGRVMYMFQ
jgi:hypothetical protein